MNRTATLPLLIALLAVGLVSFVLIRSQREGGAAVIARQHDAEALRPASVAAVVRLAPDSTTHAPGKRASCKAVGSGELLNPWRCAITYPSGRVNQYRVTINADGSYSGDHQVGRYRGRRYTSPGRISGCCIVIP
jgi:hypothetical protein